jgi:nucleoside-diphosphate-sugar epimerase
MKKVLILGANGQIAKFAVDLFLKNTDFELTLFARNAKPLIELASKNKRVRAIEGDVLDREKVIAVVAGHDVVYANLSGEMKQQAANIIAAMNKTGVKRLIFVSSMGIYGEVPGETYRSILDPYRDSAFVIEASNLDFTIIRPEWLNDKNEIDYETTHKGEPFKNPKKYVSRMSVADLIVKLATTPDFEIRKSLGVNKP